MTRMTLGSSAAKAALSAWEANRLNPPEDEPEWIEEYLTVYVNKKYVSGTGGVSPVDESKLPSALKVAAKYWFMTKRGKHLFEAYKELHGPFKLKNYRERPGNSDIPGYGGVMKVYNPEVIDHFIYWRTEDDETSLYIPAIRWVQKMGLIKINNYSFETEAGYWKQTVSIGGVKVQASGVPCEAPDEEDY